MKTSILASTALLLASAVALPTANPDPAPEPAPWRPWGGWRGRKGDQQQNCPKQIIPFTSTFSIVATPDQVVNGTTPTGGLEGAIGYYDFGLDSALDIICYNIKIVNFRGDYQSLAKTATHIHEAARGKSGPPRLAFPNPEPVSEGSNQRTSVGCLNGPFTTGVKNATTGIDTGDGFTIAKLEANPSAFFADVHSSLAVPGAVRGQLA